jgi:carboxylesterase type B
MSVGAHLTSPVASGRHLSGAILQSGSNLFTLTACAARAASYADRFGLLAGCPLSGASHGTMTDCLKGRPVGLLKALGTANPTDWLMFGDDFQPVDPLEALRAGGTWASRLPLLTGNVDDEGGAFMIGADPVAFDPLSTENVVSLAAGEAAWATLSRGYAPVYHLLKAESNVSAASGTVDRRAVAAAVSNGLLLCPTVSFGALAAASSSTGQVWSYFLNQKPTTALMPPCRGSPWLGVCHADDLLSTFGVPLGDRVPTFSFDDDDRALSREVIRIWSSFARLGRVPDADWPPYAAAATDPAVRTFHRILNVKAAPGDGLVNLRRVECADWLKIRPQC